MKKAKKITDGYIKITLLLIVAIAVGIFYPLGVIWAINSLFNLSIGYTFWNWLAIVVLHIFFQGNTIVSANNK